MSIKQYRHFIQTDALGVATKIKQERKANTKKKRNGKRK